jgi:hypothetical protein
VNDPDAPQFPTSGELRQRAVDRGGEPGSLLDERELAVVIDYLSQPKVEAFAVEQDCLDDLHSVVAKISASTPG